MDKYQRFLMKYVDFHLYIDGKIRKLSKYDPDFGKQEYEEEIFDGSLIKIKQDPNITITDYVIELRSRNQLNMVYAIKSSEQKVFEKEENLSVFRYSTSFENKLDSIEIVFRNNLANNLSIPVVYVEADKNEVAKISALNYIKKARIAHVVGKDFVDFYFEPCDTSCAKTQITLYETVNGENRLFDIYEYTDNARHRSDTLSKGKFSYTVKQFDKDGNLIFETEAQTFDI